MKSLNCLALSQPIQAVLTTVTMLWGLHFMAPAEAHSLRLKDPAHPLDQQLDTCMTKNPGTTSERHCMEALLPLWEARLVSYYQRLGGDQNARLKAAQDAWRVYATAQTRYFEQKYDLQGTMYALFLADARLQLLRHRVLQLEYDYDFFIMHR